jgi:hypothetical protein
VRQVIVPIVWIASAGLLTVSFVMNFAFGSSFGQTGLESIAYGAAFAFADILKAAAPIAAKGSFANRNWVAALVAALLWGTFTVCSAVSTIGFAAANRTFTVDARKLQAALNQSRLASLQTDQSELSRLRERLASPDVARSERLQLATAAQRLEAAIASTRGKLEDAAPVVTTPNPQAHTLAELTSANMDKVETGLVLLVALLVEMGGFGPFIAVNLAKVPMGARVPAAQEPSPPTVPAGNGSKQAVGCSRGSGKRPRLVFSAGPEDVKGDLGRFLQFHTRKEEGSALGSTDLLGRYNGSRKKRGLPVVSQRRFGDAMSSLGHCSKVRLSGGHVHYQGLAWLQPALVRSAA